MNTVIVTGPQGCGKTRYAAQLAEALGCDGFVDDWWPGVPLQLGKLHLTYSPAASIDPSVPVLTFGEALERWARSLRGKAEKEVTFLSSEAMAASPPQWEAWPIVEWYGTSCVCEDGLIGLYLRVGEGLEVLRYRLRVESARRVAGSLKEMLKRYDEARRHSATSSGSPRVEVSTPEGGENV